MFAVFFIFARQRELSEGENAAAGGVVQAVVDAAGPR